MSGIDWTRQHHGICPKCGEDKFIGHGPLCTDCYVAGAAPDSTPTEREAGDVGEVAASVIDVLDRVIVDHPMWIGDDGEPLDYLSEREARIAEFLHDATDALVPIIAERERAAGARALREAAVAVEGLRRTNPMNGDGSNYALTQALNGIVRLAGDRGPEVIAAVQAVRDERAAEEAARYEQLCALSDPQPADGTRGHGDAAGTGERL